MSADPKSLATLAIASNLNKRASNDDIKNDDCDEANKGKTNKDSRKPVIHKFRSTDEFVAGWTAACINTTALFPINKLIFRQMAGGHKAQYAADQMKEEGLRYLYRGILPPLLQKMVSVSIMFGTFGQYKKWADNKFTSLPPITNLIFASCLTGATEAILTPLERVQMLLQDRVYHRDYKNTIDALVKLRDFGPREYYRGLTCVLMRNCPSNILFFGLRDEVKKFIPTRHKHDNTKTDTNNTRDSPTNSFNSSYRHATFNNSHNNVTTINGQHQSITYRGTKTKDSMIQDFLSGAILGMFISTLFYPLSVVRTRMQTRAPGTEFLSIVKAFKAVYSERDRKFSRLFHGCLINVLRQFVSWGVINCSYEFVLDHLHRID